MNPKVSRIFTLIASLVLALSSVLAAVTTIVIPSVELGGGFSSRASCIDSAVVDFGTSINERLSSVTVSEVGADCAGLWVKLSLFTSSDGSGVAVEEIVWQIPEPSSPPVASFTLSANGTTTGVSNSIIWPASESGAAGLSNPPIQNSSVNSFLLETSDDLLTDGP